MARITGSRTVAPTSGQINNSANTNFTPNISQGLVGGNSITVVRSDATNLRGRLVLTSAGTIQALIKNLPDNVGNVLVNPNGGPPISIDQTEFSTTAQRKLAQAYFGGGVGIEKDLAVGGFIYGRIAAANTATTSSNIVVLKTNADELFFPIMTNAAGTIQQGANLYVDLLDENQDNFTTSPQAGLKYNPYQGKLITERVEVNANDNAVSTMTGAFTVTGGVGIGQDIWIGGDIMPALVGEQSIGAQDQEWANAYLNQIYTKFLGSTASNMTIAPGLGQTDIYGNLRVRDGDNPIGTAPVVTNTLYVTMDGDDTNDGRAQDPSRACRTIGAALKSPYYQPGTQILVSAGHYLEDNPLEMKEYTSIRGSDIRTTFIEPINKTQDLFHVKSGCYLNYMTFLNGRSGLLEGQYAIGYNRGAYAAAFPPQTGDNRIDLFQSPYIQNCTNQSGPWLRDGTMFVPNQTVQIPLATGMATWSANTASIIVNVESGSVEVGQSINVGKQNQGFFNARTLLLANKPFIQSQTVAWVDATFNSGSFSYNKIKCARDTGLIVNAIAQDMLYNSTSNSVFSGIQYWNQDSYTGQIPSEITATIQAITFVKGLAEGIAFSAGGAGAQATVSARFDNVLNILNTGTSGITDQISVNGLPSADTTTTDAYTALVNSVVDIQDQTIAYIDTNFSSEYDRTKCRRDISYIVNSVAFDLLHGGNYQSIKSGVYYYSYNNISTLDATNEIPQTTAAYNFIKSIIPNIVKRERLLSTYQTDVKQLTSFDSGSNYEVETLQKNIDIITSIIRNGPTDAGTLTPINLEKNPSLSATNAYVILSANIPFIKAEVIAFLDQTMNNFDYNRQLCYRDAGIILENMAYDMAFGGNEKSRESGLSYYRGVTSVIAGQETQTIGAIDYIGELARSIVKNETCPVLIPPVNIPVNSQVINTALTGGEISVESITKLLNITTDIILGGTSVAPDLTTGAGPDAAFVAAEVLMQANRSFIQENVINYINYNLCQPAKQLPYNQLKCRRDTRVILDSVAQDLLFPTPSNTQSTFAGLQYFMQEAYTGLIKEEINPTIDAIAYLRDTAIKVVQNITAADDALVGVYRYTNGTQITGANPATISEIDKLRSEFNIILTILKGKVTGWTDLIVPNTGEDSALLSVKNTVNLLLDNVDYIADEVNAYVKATYGYQFNQDNCSRDTGLIVDALAQDLLFNGTSQTDFAGIQYWSQGDYTGNIPSEIVRTTAAIEYVKTLAEKVVTNDTSGTRYQSAVSQNTGLTAATSAEATAIGADFDVILDILNNGVAGVTSAIVPNDLTGSASVDIQRAYAILQANKAYIEAEAVAYVNSLSAFTYDQVKCSRDTGLIVDAVAFDLLYPTSGNSQSTFAGLQYWNQSGYTGIISSELTTTTNAINYLKTEVAALVPAVSTATNENFVTLVNILTTGTSGVTDIIVPNGIASTDANVVSAYNTIISNKTSLISSVITHINTTNPGFVYDQTKCRRDLGYIIDSVAFDLLHGGNRQSVQSGVYYYDFSGATAVPNEIPQVTAAYKHIKEISRKIVKGETVTPTSGNAVTQVTGLPTATDKEALDIASKIDYIIDIINSGPSVANDQSPINLTASDLANINRAFTLLEANRSFIQAEVIAYINYNYGVSFTYDQTKCARDVGYMVDSVSFDLLYGGNRQAIQSGVYYYDYNATSSVVQGELTQTIGAYNYLKSLVPDIIMGYTIASPYQTVVPQVTTGSHGLAGEAILVQGLVDRITNIIVNGPSQVASKTPIGLTRSGTSTVINAANMLQANRAFLAAELVAYVKDNNGYSYDQATCARDVGYILQSLAYDLTYGGNRQAIQSGLSYYVSANSVTVIPGETQATIDAFAFMAGVASSLIQGQIYYPLQTKTKPVINLPLGTSTDAQSVASIVGTITNIIANGPGVADALVPITLDASTSDTTRNAYNIVKANQEFIVAEVIAYLDNTYNTNSFNYNQELCYRDTGLIIDAVSQDILLGGNSKSIEAGVSYWNQGYNYVAGQESTTTMAINYARDLALSVIANTPVVSVTGTVATQVINPFYQYGGDYMPQQAVARNFGIITDIITNGVEVAPPVYQGGGLFNPVGISADSVKIATKVTSVDVLSSSTVLIGLDVPTYGFADNATLYFGDTLIYPLQDFQVDKLSTQLTGIASSWNHRKVDDVGSMGGALIDGAVISDRSPIQSFVFDAYTQLNQGGIGVKVTNNGYAQLVSVFTIFCKIGVVCDNGGIASITNSNCNFGDISLLAKGYGKRDFSGTVFNPSYRAYPFSPDGVDSNNNPLPYLDQFYPDGYWPTAGRVEIFVPDDNNRPHIGLVMEVVTPEGHLNEQNFPGFLNAQPSTSTLTTGTINLTSISTNDVYVGNTVYIRDQYGREWDDHGVYYATPGTVVTDVNYNSISLNKALTSGGGDPTNNTYFTIYFCGNSYYTVQTSQIANNPYKTDTNILSSNSDPNYMGPAISQIDAHIAAVNYLKTVTDKIIANITVTPSVGNNSTQVISPNVTGGSNAQAFIDLRFTQMVDIIGASDIDAANAVVPANLITTTGTIPAGAGSAVTLIQSNIDFIAAEVAAYVTNNLSENLGNYNQTKCIRDIKLILQQIIYDLQSGGNYNSVYSGLSYWGRSGTYHVVELGEAVNRPDLFPDGAIVNFYQRSYISASGYLFEYVGAGTNYGALPQRGVADPVQGKETVQLNSGKVFFTSTDQNGDFRIGPGLVISQATGVLSGRTFVQSLYANMTPFILAIS